MERCKGESFNSSNTMRKCYHYGEWIPSQLCECGLELILRTSWTNDNPGRRYWQCPSCKEGSRCGFVKWYDPPMCPRSKKIIPGLLKRINQNEEKIAMLKSKLKSVPRGEEDEVKVMAKSRKCTSVILAVAVAMVVAIVVFGAYFANSVGVGKNGSIGVGKNVYMLP